MTSQTTAEMLKEAKDAYHQLMTGQAVNVYVDQGGERVEYSRTSAVALRMYIRELEAEISGTPAHSGAARPFF